jgi:hypothetical protein
MKCLLEKIETSDGIDYDCGYENAPTCDECILGPISVYGGVGINPKTGKKQRIKIKQNEYESNWKATHPHGEFSVY